MILLLGATGYIGEAFARQLTERGHARLVSFVAPTVLPVADAKLVDALQFASAPVPEAESGAHHQRRYRSRDEYLPWLR